MPGVGGFCRFFLTRPPSSAPGRACPSSPRPAAHSSLRTDSHGGRPAAAPGRPAPRPARAGAGPRWRPRPRRARLPGPAPGPPGRRRRPRIGRGGPGHSPACVWGQREWRVRGGGAAGGVGRAKISRGCARASVLLLFASPSAPARRAVPVSRARPHAHTRPPPGRTQAPSPWITRPWVDDPKFGAQKGGAFGPRRPAHALMALPPLHASPPAPSPPAAGAARPPARPGCGRPVGRPWVCDELRAG